MTEKRYENLVAVLRNKKNIILQGAPGVGKTFAARRLAWSIEQATLRILEILHTFKFWAPFQGGIINR